jgi:hypothetical protein
MPRITLVCTEGEYGELKRRAGLVPLSVWIKAQCLGSAVPVHMPIYEKQKELSMSGPRELSVVGPSPKGSDEGSNDQDVSRVRDLSRGGRSAVARGGPAGTAVVSGERVLPKVASRGTSKRGTETKKGPVRVDCPHGIESGYRCSLCRGIAK